MRKRLYPRNRIVIPTGAPKEHSGGLFGSFPRVLTHWSLLIPYLSLTPPLVQLRSTRDMQDFLMIVYTTVFFAVALLYVRACEKLK